MSITQKELKESINYNKDTGLILRNKDVRGKGLKGDLMTISYNKAGYPYISIKKNKIPVSKALVLYEDGFIPKRVRFIDDDITNFKYDNLLYDPVDRKLTQEYVRKVFNYDPETGILIRRIKSNGFPSGEEVGKVDRLGYRRVKILGQDPPVHRIIWLYVYGYLPEHQIDHIDRNPSNNRLDNLREVTPQCNIRNQSVSIANTTGVKGVCPYKDTGYYFAYIYINAKSYFLGQFTDFTEAVCVRLATEQCLNWHGCDRDSSALLYVQQNVNSRCH